MCMAARKHAARAPQLCRQRLDRVADGAGAVQVHHQVSCALYRPPGRGLRCSGFFAGLFSAAHARKTLPKPTFSNRTGSRTGNALHTRLSTMPYNRPCVYTLAAQGSALPPAHRPAQEVAESCF